MRIYFNSAGIITSVDTTDEAIRQGSVGNTIFANFSERSNTTHLAKINFTRPDGSKLTNLVMTPDTSYNNAFKFVLNDEWYLALSGTATLTIFLYDGDGNIVANGQAQFTIEQTDYDDDPDRPTTEQYNYLLRLVAQKLAINKAIVVIEDITQEDLSHFDNGQIFYSLSDNSYYEKIDTTPYWRLYDKYSGVLARERLLVKSNIPTVGVLKDIAGEKGLVIYSFNHKDYLISFDASDLTNIKGCAFDLFDRCFYYAENLVVGNNIGLLINNNNKIEHVDKKSDALTVYGVTAQGTQVMIPYDMNANIFTLVMRNAYGQVAVPLQPTSNEHATSKKYVDDIDYALRQLIDELIRNAFINVDTTEYPTLQSFLASQGEEGFIYLYPVNVSDLSQGYYQYIWENNQWQDLGTTQIDLSDYYTKDATNSLLYGKLDKRNTSGLRAYTHNGSTQNDTTVTNDNLGNSIPLRDGDGNIKVGSPTNNNDAASKYYVDVLGNLKVNKVSTINQLYGTSGIGFQITYTLETGVNGVIARRDSNGQLIVPQTPTNDNHATSKKYVDTSIANAVSNVYRPMGSKTVAQINAMNPNDIRVGDVYNVLDSGTITLGELQVFTGDNIVWIGSAWDKLGAEIDWDVYNETFLAAGFIQAGEIDSVPDDLTFDENGNITNPDWTGEIAIDYMSPPIDDISISAVPETLTFDVTQDYDNMITNADWTGIMTITY